jgi:hypothetical protein
MPTSERYRRKAEECRAELIRRPGSVLHRRLHQEVCDREGAESLSRLTARASRLFALALNARELGIQAYALALAQLAKYVLAQAEALERRQEANNRSRKGGSNDARG